MCFISAYSFCQNYYYVSFTDKNNVEFNPYQYFDKKAIERRLMNNVSLFDYVDMPVNQNYINQIEVLSSDYVGESRWFNMVMISASNENIEIIRNFPFVKNIEIVSEKNNLLPTNIRENQTSEILEEVKIRLSPQILRMGAEYFEDKKIDGKGIRIAVFDGGFPDVEKHEAFKHLRDNNQIIKTWNFPGKKENVYGWDSHGTEVLSCIAGIKTDTVGNQTKLGMATGAEFLLARTEINSEPRKEEFWWLQAVEWADKNGADIINSSLGYGIQRYNYSDMDGKTSLVARAANLAASKGILVCNAAGNEGSTKNWMKIITPADADSVLTVGGIQASLTNYKKIYFSSYGPTADGRLKPNVVAFGHAEVAKPKRNPNSYTYVDGTSFSSPLTAGFAACALQTNPKLTAMQLKQEIEKSADLYPYFDYALGYGVPQAKYFVNKENKNDNHNKSFEISQSDEKIQIYLVSPKDTIVKSPQLLFFNIQNENGTLSNYSQIDVNLSYAKNLYPVLDATYNEIHSYSNGKIIEISKKGLNENQILNVFYQNYYESYHLNSEKTVSDTTFSKNIKDYRIIIPPIVDVKKQEKNISKWGYNAKHYMTGYVAYSMFIPILFEEKNDFPFIYQKSYDFDFGIRYKYNICKWYALGANLEFGISKYSLEKDFIDLYPIMFFPGYRYSDIDIKNKLILNNFNLEFFQRFSILNCCSIGSMYLDLGIYGTVTVANKFRQKIYLEADDIKIEKTGRLNMEKLSYGVKARFGYSFVAVYGQFRLSKNDNENYSYHVSFPRFSVGVELSIPIRY
jgi:subtilisin family serine protease